jgi:hypothetical protein
MEIIMLIKVSRICVLPAVDLGKGGQPFFDQPLGSHLALVGFELRVGAWIDRVTPLFVALHDDGSVGAERRGQTFGGSGGVGRELRVAPGCVVTGLQTRSGSYLDALRLEQARWDGIALSDFAWTPWVGGVGGALRPERSLRSISGALAIGITGRAEVYVDGLTLVGGELDAAADEPELEVVDRAASARASSMASG